MSSTIKVNNIQNLAGDDSGIDLSTNDQIILKTANTTAITVNSNQNVGIGETSPLGKLHIRSSDASITSVNANSDELVLENNGTCGISIASATNSTGNISFIDSDDTNQGRIQYDHSTNRLKIRVNDAEHMQIESDGTTSTSETTGIGRFGSTSGVSVADDATLTVNTPSKSAGGYIITAYDTSSGTGGCFFATFRGGTTLIAEGISGDCSNADTDGKLCVFKSSGSHTITFKNRLGATRTFYICCYSAFINSS